MLAVERAHIRARLRRVTIDYKALKKAIDDEFGADYNPELWTAAYDSDDPDDVNRVSPVISAFERIVNSLVEAARSGLVGSGLAQPAGTPDTVTNDLILVRDDGGLTDGQMQLLADLSRTRNQLQHVYIDVTAEEARTAVRRLIANLPALTKGLNNWFKKYGVGV